jgi:hypothetical protein
MAADAAHASQNPVMSSAQAVRLLIFVAATYLATALGCAAFLIPLAGHEWWRGFEAGAIVGLVAAILSPLPLVWGLRRGLYHAVGGYFASAFVRAAICVGGCLVAVMAGKSPTFPTAVFVLIFYATMLIVETSIVARSLWNKEA